MHQHDVNYSYEVKNGVEIKTGYGMEGTYEIVYKLIDLAGNETIGTSNNFLIDNTVTEVGSIQAKKGSKDGEEYQLQWYAYRSGGWYEGGYTNEDIYVSKVDGRDDVSGHRRTYLEVYRWIGNGEMQFVGFFEDEVILKEDGNYRIMVITQDNMENEGYKEYYLHKGVPNVTFIPNGNTKCEQSVSTRISVEDRIGVVEKIYYQWVKEGEEPKEYTETVEKEGTVTLEDVEGIYSVYVKTEDSLGNTNVSISEPFYLSKNIDELGQMEFKLNDENGEEYKIGTYTNQAVYMNLVSQGTSKNSGTVTSSYDIYKVSPENEETPIETNLTGSKQLTEEGFYKIRLTTQSSNGSSISRNYLIYIDKTNPTATCQEIEDDFGNGVKVTATDEGEVISGINQEKTKYLWVKRNNQAPTTEEGFNDETGKYGGTIHENQTIGYLTEEIGIWNLYVYVEDNAGNSNIVNVLRHNYGGDETPPTAGEMVMTKGSKEGEPYEDGTFTNENVYGTLTEGQDEDSGITKNYYDVEKDGELISSNQTGDLELTEEGDYKITVHTEDESGNSSTREYTVRIDKTPPTAGEMIMTKGSKEGEPYEDGTFTNENVYGTLTEGQDARSGVKTNVYEVKKDGQVVSSNQTGDLELSETGNYTITVYTEDQAGNSSTREYTVKIDKNPPTIKLIENQEDVTVTITEPSTESGINNSKTKYKWVSENKEIETNIVQNKITLPQEKGDYYLSVYAEDNAGNHNEVHSQVYHVKGQIIDDSDSIYKVKDDNIYRVYPETKVTEFIAEVKKLLSGEQYEVYDKNDNKRQNQDIVATGDYVKVDGQAYRIAVIGDLNDDGYMDIIDLSRIQIHLLSETFFSEEYRKLAGDINSDDKIDIVDLSAMILCLIGSRDIHSY